MLENAHALAAAGVDVDLSHVAAIPPDRFARRQFSFSQLTGQLIEPADDGPEVDELADVESFEMAESLVADRSAATNGAGGIGSRGLGLLVHDVISRTNFADDASLAKIGLWCEHLAPQYVDFKEEAAANLAHDMIERFVRSSRGRALAAAAELHRELEFLLPWPPEYHLRGYIDCLYRDAGGAWRVVDYKTNNVSASECGEAAKQYEMQLYVYALAVERSLGVAPVDVALCFLRPGVEQVFPWNDAARQRAVEMIDAAIRAASREGEAPAEPRTDIHTRLGGSVALPGLIDHV